jgi:hypothetical protein
MTGGVRRADVVHMWANDRPTRGTFRLVGKGATWPSQGLPRGTPLLVRWLQCKILVGMHGDRTGDLFSGCELTESG